MAAPPGVSTTVAPSALDGRTRSSRRPPANGSLRSTSSRPRAARDVRRPFPRSLDRARRARRRRPHADLAPGREQGARHVRAALWRGLRDSAEAGRGARPSFAAFYLRRLAVLALFGFAAHAFFGFNVLLGYADVGRAAAADPKVVESRAARHRMCLGRVRAALHLAATRYLSARGGPERRRSGVSARRPRADCEWRRQGGRGAVELHSAARRATRSHGVVSRAAVLLHARRDAGAVHRRPAARPSRRVRGAAGPRRVLAGLAAFGVDVVARRQLAARAWVSSRSVSSSAISG